MSAASRSRAIIVALTLLLTLSGCAPAGGDGAPDPVATADAGQDAADDDTDAGDGQDSDDGDAGSDGAEDPVQEQVRTGPVADYGGPAYGDQGEAEIVEEGVWCKTIAVFWGGDVAVPEGVRFTFDEAVPDRAGLAVEDGVCGTLGATTSCVGLTVEANESGIFCSLTLRPGDDFEDGTTITFIGTLECPTVEACDAVATRTVEPGPPIVVNTPAGG
ncbi:hypothetical protein [Microbacterium sp. 2FI]|uniref:hypothetical protein n=1 Tax=Microbacterium sp. 2FI TaxID=2502193 RepID=UPI0010F8A622|nr:hypothetical protein [Microbacterium sp. 2FI]